LLAAFRRGLKQIGYLPVIGFLHLTSLETNRENLATFRQGLGETGYIENKNVSIERAQGRNDQLPRWSQNWFAVRCQVIVVLESTNGALAAKAATQTIPIVQGSDPVQIGLDWPDNLKTAKALGLEIPP
jgi:putative ABC transport system substrate-binding protein